MVDREPRGQEEIRALIGNGDVTVKAVSGPGDALRPLLESAFDCMVLSVRGDEVDLDLLRRLEQDPALRRIPVVLYVAGETSPAAEEELRRLGRVLVLRDARSPERLLDETALFLHRNAARLPEDKQAMVRRLHSSAELLAGRTVLIVDDDVRNIFAMTSLLERHGIQVISAENGNEALERLVRHARDRPRPDGRHAPGDGRLRDDARHPAAAAAALASHPGADREGDEGRSREVPGSRSVRLHRQARGGGPPRGPAPQLAAPLGGGIGWSMSTQVRPSPPQAPANVLLVDDRADKLMALEALLTDGDHRVVTARSGKEALRALLRDEFAVILLDVSMPQLDGFETATLIRGRASSEKTPIIFMTALTDLEAGMARGYSLGAVDYIQLPVEPEVLKAKVSVFVELYRTREQVRAQAEALRRRQEREHAQRLAEAAGRLDEETRRNRFFTLAPDMLGIAGLDGRLRQLNGSWERALGIPSDELCSRPCPEFLHPDDQDAMREQLRSLAEGAPTARFENRHRHGDGSYRWLSWTAAPFREEGLVYVFVRDITFRKVAEEERLQLVREQEARRAAERENKIKDHFLATLSHELRSPLTPILGWTTLLRSGQLGEEEKPRALEVIERNVRLQAQLIDDLLDVSRIVSGKLRMDLRTVDMRGVIEAALDTVRTAAEQREVDLVVDLGQEPAPVVGDQERLQQVVWNLATNAVKFSPRGSTVRVQLELLDVTVRLRVRDEGIGISPEFLPHVFDRFQQAASGTTRSHGGLGLGLAIVRHIVHAHGGTTAAASEGLGHGASFTVVLPRGGEVALAEAPTDAAPDEARRSALSGRTVLVVDDEESVRELLGVVLERHGARVVLASSVREAVACFEAERPDLLMSDIAMPEADGYSLANRLRLQAEDAVPSVALTAYAAPEDAARALAVGYRAHLAKPVDPGVVVQTLVGLLEPGS